MTEITRAEFLRTTGVALGALLTPLTMAANREISVNKAVQHPTDRHQLLKQSARASLTLDYRIDDGSELSRCGSWMKSNSLIGDTYAAGTLVEQFEDQIATTLGFESACVMPTGVMALLSIHRVIADQSGNRVVGLHPSSHHLLHEEDAYRYVHRLESKVVCPWERPILASDLEVSRDVGAVSVEMPVRWIGGQLQSPSELAELKAEAKRLNIPLVMDGARLWECGPYYGGDYAKVCEGFTAVFVSLYKMLGGLGGAVVAGDRELIKNCRVWRRRLGGDIYQIFPYVVSASLRLPEVLPQLEKYQNQAKVLATELDSLPTVKCLPSDPRTNLFRVMLPGSRATLMAARDTVLEETGIWVGDSFRPTRVPGIAQVELQLGPSYQAITDKDAVSSFKRLMELESESV